MYRICVITGEVLGEVTAVISGRAVFTTVQQMQNELGEILAGCRHLTIDVERLEDADVTFPALLCALHRRSRILNKEISLQGGLPSLEDTQGSAGPVGCRLDPGDDCRIWSPVCIGTRQRETLPGTKA